MGCGEDSLGLIKSHGQENIDYLSVSIGPGLGAVRRRRALDKYLNCVVVVVDVGGGGGLLL